MNPPLFVSIIGILLPMEQQLFVVVVRRRSSAHFPLFRFVPSKELMYNSRYTRYDGPKVDTVSRRLFLITGDPTKNQCVKSFYCVLFLYVTNLNFHIQDPLCMRQRQESHIWPWQSRLWHYCKSWDFCSPHFLQLYHSAWFEGNTVKKVENIKNIYVVTNKIKYLVIFGKLQYFKSVPCFLLVDTVHILPVVSTGAKLCCNLNEPSFICENCRDSASNWAAIIFSCSKTEKFCPLSTLQVCSIKWVDVEVEVNSVWWTQGWQCFHKRVWDHRLSI